MAMHESRGTGESVGWPSPSRRLGLVLVALVAAGAARVAIGGNTHVELATWVLVIGALLAAWWAGAPDNPQTVAVGEFEGWGAREYLGLLVGILGASLFAYASFQLFVSWDRSFDWAAPLLVLGVAVSSFGLALLDRHWRRSLVREPWSVGEAVCLLGVMALATFLRFYRLDFFPPTDGFVAIEEAQSGQGAWAIYAHGVRPWEFLLDRWMPVPFFHWLGVDLIPLRIPFILTSCLTVAVTYVLLRRLVSWRAALFATFLLSVAHWHLHYARLAHAVFPTTVLSVVVWLLLIVQAQSGGLRFYPWIGFLCGYSLYAYAAYRGIPLIAFFFLAAQTTRALMSWFSARGEMRRIARRHLLLVGAGVALVGAYLAGPGVVLIGRLRHNPMYFFEAYIRSYNNKEYYTSDWGSWLQKRWLRQVETARIFHHWGDAEQAYNLPGEPMLDPATGVLFTAGLFFCLLYWRRRFQGFFAFAFLLLLFLGATLTQTLVVARLQIIVPLAFVLIGFFADRVWSLVLATGSAWVRRLVGLGAVGVAAAALGYNWEEYFGRTMHSPVVRAVYRNYYTTAIVYFRSMPEQSFLYFVSDMHNFFQPSDYAWWRGDRLPGKVSSDLYPLLVGETGPWGGREVHVLIQRPFEQPDLAELLQTFLPATECRTIRHPEGYPHLDQMACVIRDLKPERLMSTTLRARYFAVLDNRLLLERGEPAISWGLVPDTCSVFGGANAQRCRVEWEGSFVVPDGADWELAIEARNATVRGELDGKALTLSAGVPIEGYLLGGLMEAERRKVTPGQHQLRLQASFNADTDLGVRVRLRQGGGPWRLVRFDSPDAGSPSEQAAEDHVQTGGDEGPGAERAEGKP